MCTWWGQNWSVDDNVPKISTSPARIWDPRIGQNGAEFRSDTACVRPAALTRTDKFGVDGKLGKLVRGALLERFHEFGIEASETGSKRQQSVELWRVKKKKLIQTLHVQHLNIK